MSGISKRFALAYNAAISRKKREMVMATQSDEKPVLLSVIVITKNEAHNVKECLDTVFFADEIVVVDSGSTDNTVALARAAGAVVIETPDWPGFGPQKNRALAAASGEW